MNTLTLSPFRKLHPESVNRPSRNPRRFFHVGLMILITALPAFSSGTPAKDPTGVKSDAQRLINSMDRRFFIENKGQWHEDVLFLARLGGLDAWITKYGVNYTFYKTERKETPGDKAYKDMPRGKFDHEDMENSTLLGHRVLFELEGHNPGPAREGLQKQEGYYNYLIGNDPSKHASYVGLYKEALVKDVYPGIDLRYYFDRGFPRYDFVVHPGADPSQIRFKLKGQDADEIKDNKIVFTTRFGEVQMAELRSYQSRGSVQSRLVKQGDAYAIALGRYDNSEPLIIDPLVYSTFIGGSGDDTGYDIAVDASGQAYVTGYTQSTTYDVTPGAFQTTIGGVRDAFVTKLNAVGSGLVYSTYIGGSDYDIGYSIAVGASGQTYVTGATSSNDYNVTAGVYQTTYGGSGYDVFVTKLNAAGSTLVYSTYIGGNYFDVGLGIAVDVFGQAYVTGYTVSSDYDVTPGAFQTSHGGGYYDVFVTKLNTTGSGLVYSTYIGGNNDEVSYDIAVRSGYAYVTGWTLSFNYDVTPGAFQTSKGVAFDVFVTKLNAAGSDLVYSTYIGGSGSDYGQGIAVDASGQAYVTGHTESSDYDVTPGAFQTSKGAANDVFVTKLNAAGSDLVYSTYIGGSDSDNGQGIAVDAFGQAYVTGWTTSFDYDVTPGAFQTSHGGGYYDVFVTKLNAAGTDLIYSTFIGGSSIEYVQRIAVDASGQAYVVGYTESLNYDVTPGAFQMTNEGGWGDVFVTKLCPAAIWLTSAPGTDIQTLCYGMGGITPITYATEGITYVSVSGLPAGVSYTFSSATVTISGTPAATGTFNYVVTGTGACGTLMATGAITVITPPSFTLTSAPSTVAQTVCVGTAVVPVTYAAAHVISISASGLPPGISLSFSDDTVTLSGVPDAPGTYNYTITGTGVCDTVTVTGSFTVNPLPAFTLTSAPGTESQTVCIGTAISAIQYTTTNIATVSFSGLPPGVSSLFSGTTISIYGTPSATGSYSYIITGTGSCGSQMTAGSITVLPPPTWYEDADVDGFGNAAVSMMACTAPLGYVANNTDCDDNDANNYPGNAEVWDCQDNDCDGLVDEGTGAMVLTHLNAESCGVTVLNYSHVLRANAMAGAVQYEFEFFDGTNTYYELRPNRGFYFLLFTWPMYSTTYTVRVRWYDGSNWSCWGPPCTVTTPAHPTTHLDDASCDAVASSPTHVFRAIHIPGAVQYEFAFDVGASTYYEVRPNRAFYFSLFSWDTYNTTYTVKVRWFDGAAWSDWGPPCTVTTSAMPATQLQAGDCGASAVNSTQIFQAINMPEATQYEFEFSDGVNTYYELRPNRAFYFALWNWYVPLTTYNVRVRWYDDFVWSDWGPICTLTSPSLGTTKLNMASCDAVATSPAQVFRANTIPGALNYEFEFYDGTNTYYEVRPNNAFYFALFSWPVFGTTYTVRVRWFNGTTWSPWGATCTLTYPMPTTQLQASDCGALVTSPAQVLRADNMVVASQYEFRVSDGSNVWTLVRPNRGFYLSLFGLPPGTFTIGTYTVDVRWYHSASYTWSDWGSPCDIYILDDMSYVTENIENTSFNIHAFPVPFEHTVNLTVETFSAEPVHVTVTDVNGRVVEDRRVQMEHNGLLTLGENWSNGVYMIRVQQGTRQETLKVIKSHNR